MANINNLFPSKWLKAQDLGGKEVSVKIQNLMMEDVEQGKGPQPVLHFHGKEKGLVLNKTNAMLIAHTYGPDTDAWIGKNVILHVEPVQFQGRVVDAIRCRAEAAPAATEDFNDDVPW